MKHEPKASVVPHTSARNTDFSRTCREPDLQLSLLALVRGKVYFFALMRKKTAKRIIPRLEDSVDGVFKLVILNIVDKYLKKNFIIDNVFIGTMLFFLCHRVYKYQRRSE